MTTREVMEYVRIGLEGAAATIAATKAFAAAFGVSEAEVDAELVAQRQRAEAAAARRRVSIAEREAKEAAGDD